MPPVPNKMDRVEAPPVFEVWRAWGPIIGVDEMWLGQNYKGKYTNFHHWVWTRGKWAYMQTCKPSRVRRMWLWLTGWRLVYDDKESR